MKHKRDIESYYPKKEKVCITCKKKYQPKNSVQKYCSEECNPNYKEPKPKVDLMFNSKYSEEIIIDNIQRFYRGEELTIPLRTFRNHPFIKFSILEDEEKNHQLCRQWSFKHIKIKENQLCEICKERKAVLRHHPDYSKPLFIRFLCHSCHVRIHKSKGFKEEFEIM